MSEHRVPLRGRGDRGLVLGATVGLALIVVIAVAGSAFLLGGEAHRTNTRRCPWHTGPTTAPALLEPPVGTGIRVRDEEVALWLSGPKDCLGFDVGLRDLRTGSMRGLLFGGAAVARDGRLSPSPAPPYGFVALQLNLGDGRFVDLGLFTASADRILVESGGRTWEATTARSTRTSWTFYWLERTGLALPSEYRYPGHTGPGMVLVAAYDSRGNRMEWTYRVGPLAYRPPNVHESPSAPPATLTRPPRS